jgi:exodeoxyribonuclease V alpha subunit
MQLNEGQVRAIEVASDAPLMVITGGPGCGKTTMVQTLVKLWCAQKKMVRIAAPTGEHLVAARGHAAVGCAGV